MTTKCNKPALAHNRTKHAVFGENTTRSLLYVATTGAVFGAHVATVWG